MERPQRPMGHLMEAVQEAAPAMEPHQGEMEHLMELLRLVKHLQEVRRLKVSPTSMTEDKHNDVWLGYQKTKTVIFFILSDIKRPNFYLSSIIFDRIR